MDSASLSLALCASVRRLTEQDDEGTWTPGGITVGRRGSCWVCDAEKQTARMVVEGVVPRSGDKSQWDDVMNFMLCVWTEFTRDYSIITL